MPIEAALLQSMEWRSIGPHRGGRVVAVAGDPVSPAVFYFGACSGGIWKTTDAGVYWENVSDGFVKTAAVGAIAVADSDPNVVYAGMGEACIRSNVSHGDGVYKSTDGGQTWVNVGLKDTRHIGRVRIHPKNAEIVYVAALGHAFGPNEERGVFRSKDGGKSWEKVLFRSDHAGAVDLSMDESNPRILYAAIWQTQRYPWSLESGGPDSSIYKSTDGGDTWTELTNKPGLPKGLKGRIGVACSPAQSGRVWALVEAQDGGLFRSDDGGESWQRISEDRNLRQRAWYYMHVFADPKDAETCYILNLNMWKSVDGGKTFTQVTTPHGDNHDLWIDPRNPQRMVQGNDGGANVSSNGGATWSTIYNQPTAQFYHLTTDTRQPYRVYGTQQDNSAISTPSRSYKGAIPYADSYTVGSSESGYIQVRPDNPNIVYSGSIGSSPGGGGNMLRYDHASGQVRIVTAWPEVSTGSGAGAMKYRFQWTYPIQISPHDPNVIYITGNVVFRSSDDGTSWDVISPDLTRNDAAKLVASGGPVSKDTTGAEHYCTIFAFAESPHQQGTFWAGSDDGLVHISRDNGGSWQNVTPPDLPEWGTVSMIEPSPHDPATAYLAVHRYKLDDTKPYLWKTNNYGQSWQRIDSGLPQDDFTRCIREDPNRRGLLYAGTETDIYVSFDDGAAWQSLRGNLPIVPVHDLQIKEGDLVAATHGRAFWILDDLSTLYQLKDGLPQDQAVLLKPSDTTRWRAAMSFGRQPVPGKNYQLALGAAVTFYEKKLPNGKTEMVFLDAGKNPPDGVAVHYYLKEKPQGEVKLTFLDREGKEIRSYSSEAPEEPAAEGSAVAVGAEGRESAAGASTATGPSGRPAKPPEPKPTADAGMNRFNWTMRYADARPVPGDVTTEQATQGPLAPPGSYSVRLEAGGKSSTQPFEIRKNPLVAATREDLEAQFEFLIQVRDKLSETHDAINTIRNLRQQIEEWQRRVAAQKDGQAGAAEFGPAATRLLGSLTAIEEELIQPRAQVGSDTLNFPAKLNAKLSSLSAVIASADWIPTRGSYQVFEKLAAEIDAQLRQLQQVVDSDVKQFGELVQKAAIPAIVASATPGGR